MNCETEGSEDNTETEGSEDNTESISEALLLQSSI
jgi:hypothetical protein